LRLPLVGLLILLIAGLSAGAWALLGAKPADPSPRASDPAPPPAPAPAPVEPKQAVEPPPAAAEPKAAEPAPAEPKPKPEPEAAATPTPPVAVAPLPAPGPTPPPDPAAQAERAQRLVASAEKRYEKGDFAGAVAEYRRSLGAKPTPAGFVGLGRALYDSNQTAEAIKMLEASQKLDASYAPSWLLLGEIHQGEGRVAPARAAYQRFLQLQPAGEQARAVREILAKQLK
jgi:tetratricopeptide (TPR) repeat protein